MSKDEVYVVTGGAGGMGLASAHALADRGMLLLLDLDEGQLDGAAEALRGQGARVETQRCDVASLDDVAAAAERVQSMGPFRALVHTAGVSPEMADGRRVLEVDLVGSARVAEAVFPLLRPGSAAVFIGSIAGYSDVDPAVDPLLDDPLAHSFVDDVERALGRPLDGPTAYVLAKRGVVRLVERLSGSWGALGARTVAIAPGLINTAMGRYELERQPTMVAMVQFTPIKRPDQALPGRPEDIAATAAFLVSDEAAFISGCDIRVDGGLLGAAKHAVGLG